MSLTRTLTDSAAFATKYTKGWAFTCEALLKLLENPPVLAATDDLIVDQDVDDMSFGVGFTQLTTIKRPVRDQWPDVRDVKAWVGSYLKEANRKRNGTLEKFAEDRLAAEVKPFFAEYLRS